MPDDELIEESGVLDEETTVPDVTEQEQEPSSEPSTTETEESTSDFEDSTEESSDDVETSTEEMSSDSETSDNTMEETSEESTEEVHEETSEESLEAYMLSDDFEEFLSSSVVVDRYQYTILERLEFIQYALAIEIALLFLILFMRYKK